MIDEILINSFLFLKLLLCKIFFTGPEEVIERVVIEGEVIEGEVIEGGSY